MNYWLLLASPDKWFCDRCIKNAKVNDTLKTLKQQSWRIRKDYFANAPDLAHQIALNPTK